MNKAIICGRLTRNPEARVTQSGKSVTGFALAVDGRYKNSNGERKTYFINFTAWGSNSDFISKYCTKGTKLIVEGEIQTRTYDDKDGKKVYVTEVVAEEIEFAESKKTENSQVEYGKLEADNDTSLPFDL